MAVCQRIRRIRHIGRKIGLEDWFRPLPLIRWLRSKQGEEMTDEQKPEFQRARSEEQRVARRTAILRAARDLLEGVPVSGISLRELSRKVDLSKTNVVRYFETREAVFFTLLNQELEEWLVDLRDELANEFSSRAAKPIELAHVLASAIGKRPIVCKLWSALGGELETNISPDAVRAFKLEHTERQDELGHIIAESLPELGLKNARELVSMIVILVAGLWPFANPSASVIEALEHPALSESRVDFVQRLSRLIYISTMGILESSRR